MVKSRGLEYDEENILSGYPAMEGVEAIAVVAELSVFMFCQAEDIKPVFRHIDSNGTVHKSFPSPGLVMRASRPCIRSGR
jgi:hypothetical protein